MLFATLAFCLPKIFGKLNDMSGNIQRSQVERLAIAVLQRIDQLGLTDEKVRLRGGPSKPTLAYFRKLRDGDPVEIIEPTNRTLDKLDACLGWASPSAHRLLYFGDEPTVGSGSRSGDDAFSAEHRDRFLSLLRDIGKSVDEAVKLLGG